MFNRLRNLWRLSKAKDLHELLNPTPETIAKWKQVTKPFVKGDGKAVFFGPGTEEEYNEMIKEDKGIKGLFGTGK